MRGQIANGLVDRAWPVRVAAALALGECRSPESLDDLQPLLLGPFRAERIAAAAAILSCGGMVSATELITPRRRCFGASDDWRPDVVTRGADRAGVHASGVLDCWRARPAPLKVSNSPAVPTLPSGERSWPARRMRDIRAGCRRRSIGTRRNGETEYVLAKPFSPINRAQNTRLLHTFAAICEHVRAPARARILDLGGGSAWVSELLAKLGYTPVTLDVSSALLSVGKQRFSRECLLPRFVAGDMTALPIASGSMSAVVVIDALHHAPDVPAVFREAFRVLDTGGAFLLAEPGEGHAETEKSRGEMLEHGVHEREIHVAEVFEVREALRASTMSRVVANHVPSITLTSAQLDAAARVPCGRVAGDERRPADGPACVHHAVRLRSIPLFVCRKGRRAADSTVPSHLARGDPTADCTARRGQSAVTVTLRNTGDTHVAEGRSAGPRAAGHPAARSRTQIARAELRTDKSSG